MKAIVCEMCGSQEFAKMDGMYVCQHCRTKYDPEEAKKLMVEVSGKVEIDRSKELDNLIKAARNARSISDNTSALKHYEKISSLQPDNWEALFYSVVLRNNIAKAENIVSSATNISNCLRKVLEFIKANPQSEQNKVNAVKEVKDTCHKTVYLLTNIAEAEYKATISKINSMALSNSTIANSNLRTDALRECKERCISIINIMIYCGDYIEEVFVTTNQNYKEFAVSSWKTVIDYNNQYRNNHKSPILLKPYVDGIVSKIHKYEPGYTIPQTKSGCYVATSVYGSYNCPQVWTLRRYRDYTLAQTWYGRAFIKTYYAVSPTLVKWFGHTDWFRNMWKPRLDKMVKKLNNKGVKNTPYNDRKW